MKQPVSKKEYAVELKKWINHKKQLERVCGYYKEGKRPGSMSAVLDLYVMVKNDCDGFGLDALFQLVRVHETHLRNILPMMLNRSYESSLVKLEELLAIAKGK